MLCQQVDVEELSDLELCDRGAHFMPAPARKLHLSRTSFGKGDMQTLPRMGQDSEFYFTSRCMHTVAMLNMDANNMQCIGCLTAQQMQANSAAQAHLGHPIAQGASNTESTYKKMPVFVQAITTKPWQV